MVTKTTITSAETIKAAKNVKVKLSQLWKIEVYCNHANT
jgi:hypothetical protein